MLIARLALCSLLTAAVWGCSESSDAPAPAVPEEDTGGRVPAATSDAGSAAQATAAAAMPDSLHDLMEEVQDHFRFLRRQGESAEFTELQQQATRLRELLVHAKTMTPHQIEDAPAEQRDALAAAYQKHLNDTMPQLDRIDAAIEAEDREALASAVHDLHEVEEAGHEALDVKH